MIKVTQYFTGHGMLGVILLVIGTVATAWLTASAMSAPAYAQPTTASYLMMGAAGLAVLISLPLMLIGRAYDVEIRHIPKDRIS